MFQEGDMVDIVIKGKVIKNCGKLHPDGEEIFELVDLEGRNFLSNKSYMFMRKDESQEKIE